VHSTTGNGSPGPGAAATPEQTLLIGLGETGQLANDRRPCSATTPPAQWALVLMPSGMLVNDRRHGGWLVRGSRSGEFAGAVGSLLGVRVDHTWRLTPAALAT